MKLSKIPALTRMLRREQTSVTEEHHPAFLGDNQAVCIFSKLTDVSDTANSEGLRLRRQSFKWPKAEVVLAQE